VIGSTWGAVPVLGAATALAPPLSSAARNVFGRSERAFELVLIDEAAQVGWWWWLVFAVVLWRGCVRVFGRLFWCVCVRVQKPA
jgi:hypothetical protein